MNYGALIGDSFRLTMRSRYLWFFGFFAGGTATNLFFNAPPDLSGAPQDLENFDPGSMSVSAALLAQSGFGGGAIALVAALAALAFLLFLVVLALSLLSRAALVESAAAIDRGEERRFTSAWRAGIGGMWRVLGLGILFFLVGVGLFLALAIPAGIGIALVFAVTQSVAARVIVIAAISLFTLILFAVIFIPYAIIGQLAIRMMLLAGDGVAGCIGGGYGVFRRNIGRSLLVWLIRVALMIGLNIALLLAAAIVGLILFLPTIALVFAELATAAIITGVIAGVILLALFLVASGALGTFGSAYWTLAYLRLQEPAARTETGV